MNKLLLYLRVIVIIKTNEQFRTKQPTGTKTTKLQFECPLLNANTWAYPHKTERKTLTNAKVKRQHILLKHDMAEVVVVTNTNEV